MNTNATIEHNIIEDFLKGITYRALSNKYKIPLYTIYRFIKKHNVYRIVPINEIINLRNEGMSLFDIAVKCKVTVDTVKEILRKHNVYVSTYTAEEEAVIVDLYKKGATITELKHKGYFNIKYLLQKHGLVKVYSHRIGGVKKTNRRKLNHEMIIMMYTNNNMSTGRIAEIFGVSRQAISCILKQHSVAIRKR